MSGIANNLHKYYSGLGTSGFSSTLPLQTIPAYKKKDAWEKNTMDALEQIGIRQMYKNLEFRDYFKMVEGRLVKIDFLTNPENMPENLEGIRELRSEYDLPTYIRHYDLIGMIINQLTGELPNMLDNIRIDSIDEYSENDYLRQKQELVKEYVKQSFTNELNRLLALKGIDPLKKDFQSEEEQQQYLQYLEQEKAKIKSPQEIEREMNKSWKLRAVEWAENTYESDTQRFFMEAMEEREMRSYLLTGRFFTHYHIGYDYYKPEEWSAMQTFFSEDLDIRFPQDGEYAGRLLFLSASDIIQRWGSKLSKKVQEDLSSVHDNYKDSNRAYEGMKGTELQRPVGQVMVPDQDYFDRDLWLQLQSAFDVPLGETQVEDSKGNITKVPSWLSDYNNSNSYISTDIAKRLREDISVRNDLFRVTEAYWRSYSLYAALRYETKEGFVVEEMVSEEILPDFIKENEIVKLNTVSLEEFEKETERVNQICYFYIPVVYKGKKIAGTNKSKDIYFDVGPLEFQIKGDSNLFDVKLPVAGYIGNSFAQKIRSYQLGYNIALNQIYNILEKELGVFLAMDINLLATEYKEEGDTRDQLSLLRDTIRDLGFLPLDLSKKNTQSTNTNQNVFQKHELTFDNQIARRVELAEYYKKLAFEQIGITEERRGTPNEYKTNEGIKVGQEASFAQTKNVFSEFDEARRKKIELHLTVAQYCVTNDKDISNYYRNSDGNIVYLNFADDKFHLRKFGILPVSDGKAKKNLETLKSVLLNNNTSDNDILDFAKIAQSDSFISIIEYGKQRRAEVQAETQIQREHEQTLVDKQIQANALERQRDREWEEMSKDKDRDNKIRVEEIQALGRASDKKSDTAGIQAIKAAADASLKEQELNANIDIKNRELDLKTKETDANIALKIKELNNQLQELKIREKEADVKMRSSIINKN